MGEETERLPGMRQDLHLYRGARRYDGLPTWTLFDPVRNRYFQLLEKEFSIIASWSRVVPEDIAEQASQILGAQVSADDVKDMFRFLLENELLDASNPGVRNVISGHHERRQVSLLRTVMFRYLFFRIPLARPDKFLDAIYPFFRFAFTRKFVTFALFVAVGAWLLALRKPSDFASGFLQYTTFQGMAIFGITLVLVKVVHELGHGLACKHFGLKVPTFGVAFMVMWPVLYTDATDAWRLQSPRKRALISVAGLASELFLASFSLLLWSFLPDGALRQAVFVMATTSWIFSLLINVNPFLRYDGYYFLSDIMNLPNMQTRSFEFGKWHLREKLFRLGRRPPESLTPKLERFMVYFAYGTWVYRFLLFLGIALLVYHLFFKVLGVILFFVEIWWFLVRPILKEMSEWRGAVRDADRRHFFIVVASACFLFMVVVFPWRTEVTAPAVLEQNALYRVFNILPGRVQALHVSDGDQVEKGDLLITLEDPGRQLQRRMLEAEVIRAREALRTEGLEEGRLDNRLVLEQRLEEAQQRLSAFLSDSDNLTIRADRAGRVVDLLSDLHEGRWLAPSTQLLSISGNRNDGVVAWLDENQVKNLGQVHVARFYPLPTYGFSALQLGGVRLSTGAVETLNPPYHASDFGGAIEATAEKGGMKPLAALYRADFSVLEEAPAASRVRGWVHLTGQRQSILVAAWRWFWGALIRESAF